MKDLLWAIVALLIVVACSGPTPEELASLAAKGYYDHLIHGEYEQFLEGKNGADSLPDGYREQLLASYRQFMAQQENAHHGIREVRISRASTDTLLHYTNVFLVLCYGDSVNEEIVVPMIEQDKGWRMK
jgi:hypothetical protein